MTKTADVLMQEALTTYHERNKVYGSSYHKHGRVMAALFPEGKLLVTVHDFNTFGILNMIVSKLCRISQSPDHRDSIHDTGVYSFMYEELLALREDQLKDLGKLADALIQPFEPRPGASVPDVMSVEEMKRHLDAGTIKLSGPSRLTKHNPVDDENNLRSAVGAQLDGHNA